jgi:hypothetical protein
MAIEKYEECAVWFKRGAVLTIDGLVPDDAALHPFSDANLN